MISHCSFDLHFSNKFPGGSDSKASACNAGDPGSIPGSGRSLEKEMATHSGTLAWRIPWTEDPGRLQSTGLQRSGTTEHFHFHFHFHFLSKSLQMVTAVMKLKDSCSLGEKL